MAVRGLAYSQYTAWGSEPSSYTSIPVTDFTFNVNRNPIAEKAMNIAGEPKIYGGTYAASGSITAAYRPSEFGTLIVHGVMSKTAWVHGGTGSGIGDFAETTSGYKNFFCVACGDEFGNVSAFASCAFTSCELSIRSGEFGKITFNWVGVKKISGANPTIATPSYNADIPIFYNAVLQIGEALVKVTGLTAKINRPLASDDFVLGSEYTQSITQSDNVTVEGTINLSNKEYAKISTSITTGDESNWDDLETEKTNTSALGTLSLQFNNPDGSSTPLGGIYFTNMIINTTDVSVSSRQRFEKTLSFRVATTATTGISWNFTGTAPSS